MAQRRAIPTAEGSAIRSYIVRIYCEGRRRNGDLLGTVEAADGGRQWTFKDGEELWGILKRSAKRMPGRPRNTKGKGRG